MVFIGKHKQSKPQYQWLLLLIFISFDYLLVLLTLRIDRKDGQRGSMGVPVERHKLCAENKKVTAEKTENRYQRWKHQVVML